MKVHYIDTRLLVNAGIQFPSCYASAKLLDMDKTRLPSTREHDAVTCKHCLRIIQYNVTNRWE